MKDMIHRIPTIEEIYEEYYRETFFAERQIYPQRLKRFDKLLDASKTEILNRFQNFIKRNFGLVDWKLYIKACAQYFKRKFDLNILGSLNGNKIYRSYISYNKTSDDKDTASIKDDIVNTIKFIKEFAKENDISIKEYFLNRDDLIPIVLKHIYSGTTSLFFYACLNHDVNFLIFSDVPDDVFYELFNCSRNEFLNMLISTKRDVILRRK